MRERPERRRRRPPPSIDERREHLRAHELVVGSRVTYGDGGYAYKATIESITSKAMVRIRLVTPMKGAWAELWPNGMKLVNPVYLRPGHVACEVRWDYEQGQEPWKVA